MLWDLVAKIWEGTRGVEGFLELINPPIDLYHALTWPELSYVAVDPKGRIVGYILAKM